MPTHYYLCPVVGDGSDDNPRRLKVADYYGNHSAVLPDDGTWGIAVVADADHTASISDPDIHPFPSSDLSVRVVDLDPSISTQITDFLSLYGITVSEADTLRDVLVRFSTLADGNFDFDRFGVSD
jgi:hypothetical protein